ncbi:MAG: HNH endonuclease [Prevotellaceae bacterium]|nr:HNH endonuclease [Prevotellaceae bacterium]
MEKANLKHIALDAEDAALFSLNEDLLLKAKSIKYSILPKLNILLEETLSRIRKIYNIEVLNENSIIHSAPNFREKRDSKLKIDYTYAFIGFGGSRQPIWEGFKRKDNQPTKIIPYIIGYWFDKYGLTLLFDNLRYIFKFTKETYELYFDFLIENVEYIQTIQCISEMSPDFYVSDENNKTNMTIKPFTEMLKEYKDNYYYYQLCFRKRIHFPLDYNDFNFIVNSFVIFFPIYYSLLQIAQGKKNNFRELISQVNIYDLYKEYPYSENNDSTKVNGDVIPKIDETKFVKAGIRWQVFERDDFKCVSCGKSASDGAILHVDHIIPRSKGGGDTMENYQTLCHLCNIGKSNKSNKNLREKCR